MEVLKEQVPGIFAEAEAPISRVRGGGGSESSSSSPARRIVKNLRPNQKLVKRWTAAKATDRFTKLSDFRNHWTGEGTYESPKDTSLNKLICLKYLLETTCTENCPRSGTHKMYGADTYTGFHGFLDKCQVAPSE